MDADGPPPRDENLTAGYDEENPYDDDLSEYPDWWLDQIEHFREYGMRPYRPPRFADGEIATERLLALEERLDVSIRLRAHNPDVGDEWGIVLDGSPIGTIDRYRDGDGYTVYDVSWEEFRETILTALGHEAETDSEYQGKS